MDNETDKVEIDIGRIKVEGELRLREEELRFEREKWESEKARSKGFSGLSTALIASAFALSGTILGALIQGSSNIELEKHKLQTQLVLDAIKTGNQKDALTNLQFFVEIGFLDDPESKISDSVTVAVLPSDSKSPLNYLGENTPKAFLQFATSLEKLDQAVRSAFDYQDPEWENRFIDQIIETTKNDDISGIESISLRLDAQNPFSLKVPDHAIPLYIRSQVVGESLRQLNSAIFQYAVLLGQLASLQDFSSQQLNEIVSDINRQSISAIRAIDANADTSHVSFFNSPEALPKNGDRLALKVAISDNQIAFEKAVNVIRTSLVLFAQLNVHEHQEKSHEKLRNLVAKTNAGKNDLKPLIKEIIELNSSVTQTVTRLGTLHDAYALVFAAHRDLGDVLEESTLVPASIQKLNAITKNM